jgi:hypothetical protein
MERSEDLRPLPPFPFSNGEGAVQHYKTRHLNLPHHLSFNADQNAEGDLLFFKLNIFQQPGLPLLWRGNEGEAFISIFKNNFGHG